VSAEVTSAASIGVLYSGGAPDKYPRHYADSSLDIEVIQLRRTAMKRGAPGLVSRSGRSAPGVG
jgi:hypothetical protein